MPVSYAVIRQISPPQGLSLLLLLLLLPLSLLLLLSACINSQLYTLLIGMQRALLAE
jgi:hypothetical protein